jgi:Glycosyl transferase family 11
MIVSKLSDGLGNQLFQYAIARAISLKNKTTCVLDIAGFKEGSLRKFGLDHFNVDCTLTDNFKVPLLNKIAGYKLGISSFRFHYYIDKIWEFDEKLQQDKGNFIHLSGYWGWPAYFKDIHPVLADDFRLKMPLEIYNRKWVAIAGQKNTVSLHIRRSDYAMDKNASEFFGTLDIRYYQKAISYITEQISDPYFLLFSDDLNWVREKFIPLSGIKNYSIVEDNCLTHPAEELTLMSYCKHNIMANSTFSWWGAWLNLNKERIVIMPAFWYADKAAQELYRKGHFDVGGCIKL